MYRGQGFDRLELDDEPVGNQQIELLVSNRLPLVANDHGDLPPEWDGSEPELHAKGLLIDRL